MKIFLIVVSLLSFRISFADLPAPEEQLADKRAWIGQHLTNLKEQTGSSRPAVLVQAANAILHALDDELTLLKEFASANRNAMGLSEALEEWDAARVDVQRIWEENFKKACSPDNDRFPEDVQIEKLALQMIAFIEIRAKLQILLEQTFPGVATKLSVAGARPGTPDHLLGLFSSRLRSVQEFHIHAEASRAVFFADPFPSPDIYNFYLSLSVEIAAHPENFNQGGQLEMGEKDLLDLAPLPTVETAIHHAQVILKALAYFARKDVSARAKLPYLKEVIRYRYAMNRSPGSILGAEFHQFLVSLLNYAFLHDPQKFWSAFADHESPETNADIQREIYDFLKEQSQGSDVWASRELADFVAQADRSAQRTIMSTGASSPVHFADGLVIFDKPFRSPNALCAESIQ